MRVTMQEFIEKYELGVDITNPQATKVVSDYLVGAGFRQERVMHNGKRQNVWTNEGSTIDQLKSKLASLKL